MVRSTETRTNFRLNGRTALVTGAGRGLGAGMARGLAQAGARVVLMSRTESELVAVAAEINAAGGNAINAAQSRANRSPMLSRWPRGISPCRLRQPASRDALKASQPS